MFVIFILPLFPCFLLYPRFHSGKVVKFLIIRLHPVAGPEPGAGAYAGVGKYFQKKTCGGLDFRGAAAV
jgi:hypothetical protein